VRKIIIVAPHFPPSNLAAVHRSRLFAMHLPDFGWEPIIVTVHERYYEEKLDYNLEALLPEGVRVEKVGALPTKPIRIVGDIGVRGFIPLLGRILKTIRNERVDFLYIPIPSNFTALLGRIVNEVTGTPYGIDYIDPWVHYWPGSEKKFTKHWLSRKLSEWLEPIAVKNASLITGVAPGYYEDVLLRNPHLRNTCLTAAMPYGGEKLDHQKLHTLSIKPYIFDKTGKIDFVYAGAMLPKAFEPLKAIIAAIKNEPSLYSNIRFHFIGTGKSPNDPIGYNIKPVAERAGLWQSVIFEYPARIPYLDVLVHLQAADAIFVLGSTEPHYTPSKVYQAVLSEKPILAVLHQRSTACQVIHDSRAGKVLAFEGEREVNCIQEKFNQTLVDFLTFLEKFLPQNVNLETFEQYSAFKVTKILVDSLNKVNLK